MLVSILLTLLLLSILVFVHELGHFIAAKSMGIKVLEFALFMGPKIFSFKKGETTYSVRCIPIGGFCSMEGEEITSGDERAYSNKKWYKKAVVLIAGPAMNIILAIILAVILFFTNGYSSTDVGGVVPGSEADKMGIKPGDKIVALNDMGISSSVELGTYEQIYKSNKDYEVKNSSGKTVTVKAGDFLYTVKGANGKKYDIETSSLDGVGIREKNYRNKTNKDTRVYISKIYPDDVVTEYGVQVGDKITALNGNKISGISDFSYYKSRTQYPLTYEIEKKSGEKVSITLQDDTKRLGVDIGYYVETDPMNQGVFKVLGDASSFTFSLVKVTVKSIAWLFTGKVAVSEVTGPVGIVSVVDQTVATANSFQSGLYSFLLLTVLISVNLGIFNILPFPALDGGRLIFAFIEGIRGKKIKPEHEGIVSLVGFVILIGLSILIFIKDIVKLF